MSITAIEIPGRPKSISPEDHACRWPLTPPARSMTDGANEISIIPIEISNAKEDSIFARRGVLGLK